MDHLQRQNDILSPRSYSYLVDTLHNYLLICRLFVGDHLMDYQLMYMK